MTIARARLPLGKRWNTPPEAMLRPQFAWDRLGLEIIEARYLLRDAKFDAAAEQAQRVYAASVSKGYTGIAAHAGATIAACAGLRGDEAQEQRYYVAAWKCIARSGDRLAGCDAFTMPVVRPKDLGPLVVDAEFGDAVAERAQALSPNAPVRAELCEKAIAFANGSAAARDAAESLAAQCGEPAFATLGCDLALTLPHERRERWLLRWNEAVRLSRKCIA